MEKPAARTRSARAERIISTIPGEIGDFPAVAENRQRGGRSTRQRVCSGVRLTLRQFRRTFQTVALDDTALLAHRLVHQLRKAAHQGECRLLSRAFGKGREAHHVGEQDRNLPALGYNGGAKIILKAAGVDPRYRIRRQSRNLSAPILAGAARNRFPESFRRC